MFATRWQGASARTPLETPGGEFGWQTSSATWFRSVLRLRVLPSDSICAAARAAPDSPRRVAGGTFELRRSWFRRKNLGYVWLVDEKLKHHGAAVFFDLDGTLLDTSYLHTFAWWRALDDEYERVPMSRIHPLIGMGSHELLSSLLGSDRPSISRAHGRYFSGLHEFIRPLPGASELVERSRPRVLAW